MIYPNDIDTDEASIHHLIPALPNACIRRASYANIIYSDLRSGLVHEYKITGNATSTRWHEDPTRISYINLIVMPDEKKVADTAREYRIAVNEARDALTATQRRLYFPYSYIRQVAEETASSVFTYWDSIDDFFRPQPASWWIEGR